jgi:anti-sigma regulatory factor (Ser/Thr protein kinase)
LGVEHRLPHEPAAASTARQLAKEFAEASLPEARLSDFQTMVSELVSNAVRHAPAERNGTFGLRLETDEGVVRAVVMDGGSEFRFDRATLDNSRNDYHFGLLIVDSLADRWGLSLNGKKAIWFEIDRQIANSRVGAHRWRGDGCQPPA